MAKFGKKSLKILDQLHNDLQLLCLEAIERVDFSLICGYRDKEAQERAVREHKSKAHYGQSPHNFNPALAFDFAPYPCDWEDTNDFKRVAKIISDCADELNIDVIWGGNFTTQKDDYGHFELTKWKGLK